ncbi:MAG: hypothetical protein WHT81_09635 [Rectinemataceae bacterium]|nr:hypothetical protein [Spirochaetaceae bacterium]
MKGKGVALFLIAAAVLIGCELDLGKGTAGSQGMLSVEVTGVPGESRGIGNDSSVVKVFIRVFDASRNVMQPKAGTLGSISTTETNAVELVKVQDSWKASFGVTNPAGTMTLVAYAVDAQGRHLYSGHASTSSENGSISISVSDRYVVGGDAATNWGPAGGYIFYDKGSYSDGWRYLEASPHDLDGSWNGFALDSGYSVNAQGDVIDASNNVVASRFDWYWGPNNQNIGTEMPVSKGTPNTLKLVDVDATTSVTPRIKKFVPRPYNAEALARRMVSTTVWNLEKNGVSGWFTPSKEELEEMYNNLRSFGGFAAKKYWSSTEDEIFTRNDGEGAKQAYYVDFGADTLTSNVAGRYQLYRVRPARRF